MKLFRGSDPSSETGWERAEPDTIPNRTRRVALGPPIGTRPLSLWVLVAFYFVLLVTMVMFLTTTSYVRKATVTGQLVPSSGLVQVMARRDGVAAEVFVRNGQLVDRNAPLVALSADTRLEDGLQVGGLLSDATDAKALALRKQNEADVGSRRDSLRDIGVRRAALDGQIQLLVNSRALAVERVKMSEERLAKYEPLRDKGYVSGLQIQQSQEALNANRQGLAEIDQRLVEARKQRDLLAVEQRQIETRALQSEATQASGRSELISSRAMALEQHRTILTAERRGLVTALRVQPGVPIKAGESLATILPEGSRLRAEVWVPSNAIGFIRVGDSVKLMFDAFPYQTFGMSSGHVVEVATAPVSPQDLPPGTAQEPRYQVLIELESQTLAAYGRRWRLLPGMKVDAIVVLEKRTALQWLLDPFLAFRQRMGA